MDYFDKQIKDVLNKEIYVSEEIEDTIRNSLNTKPKKFICIKYKLIAIIISFIATISGVVYAGYHIYKNVFNDRKGIETAIEQGYISNGTEKYVASNNIFVKIDNTLINDKNMDINFNILLKDREIQEIENIEFEKLLIVDEKNNILYSNNVDQLQNYISTNNLDIEIGNFNDNYFNSGSSNKIRQIYEDSLQLIYNITSNNNYPINKEITIYAENIILKNSNNLELINGSWIINEKLPEIFQDRQAYKYHLVNINEDIINAELTVYNTETTIDLTIKNMNNYNQEELNAEYIELSKKYDKAKEENNLRDIQELKNKLQDLQNKLLNTIDNLYIKNSNNETFTISNSETIHGSSYIPMKENYIKYSNIVDLSLYDVTENLQVYFTYNGKEYNLIFSR